jgi:hypothetical protein
MILLHVFRCWRSSICRTVSVSVVSADRSSEIPNIVFIRYRSRKSRDGSSGWRGRGGEPSIFMWPFSSGKRATRYCAISSPESMTPAEITKRLPEARSMKIARMLASAISFKNWSALSKKFCQQDHVPSHPQSE